jgi:UDP-glucose:glycoprotein glucosyltransferase
MNIGLQAAQLIADSATSSASPVGPLQTLKHLAQNFPRYASSLARRVVVQDALEAEVAGNQVKAQGGVNAAWLNGAPVSEGSWDAFS